MDTTSVSENKDLALRSTGSELSRQLLVFQGNTFLRDFLEAIPVSILILNEYRQIVFANRTFLQMVKFESVERLSGMRLGEILGCANAGRADKGCNTSDFCFVCGALTAMLNKKNPLTNVQECHILTRDSCTALDFRVLASDIRVGEEDFTLFTLLDISSDNRRKALERIFFHDVLNTTGAISGLASVIDEMVSGETREYTELLLRTTDQLAFEINSQRDLILAENAEIKVKPETAGSFLLLNQLGSLFKTIAGSQEKVVFIHPASQDFTLITDINLVYRILGNLLKNALEAARKGDKIELGARKQERKAIFWVKNPTFMPLPVQAQIFQRAFSTKGPGRGLGTYSAKLLSERYLQGRVWFTTAPETGTTFFAEYPEDITKL